MTDLVRLGPLTYPSLTAAAAALQGTSTPQLIEILGSLSGAPAFAAINPGGEADVTISGVVQPDGSLPELQALGTFVRLAWGKAIINCESVAKLTIQNLLLTNAACSDANGAAIRGNGACKALYIKNVVARNNEDGILSNDSEFISIEDSLFDNNGQSSREDRRGYSHNAYVAGKRIEVRRSSFINSQYGHDFKSRMLETYLYQSYFGGSKQGRALDLANGGVLFAEDCVFEKFAEASQNNLVDVGAEGIDGRTQKYTFKNCKLANDIGELARDIQYVLNRSDFELELLDCEFAGPAWGNKDQSSLIPGRIKVVSTGGPKGPQKPVGRAADAKIVVQAPVVPAQPEPAPGVPAYGKWERAGYEYDAFTSPENTLVRYGCEPTWVQKTVSGSWTATNEFFGSDPAPGVRKEVQIYFPPVETVIVPVTPQPAPVVASPSLAAALEAAAVVFVQALGYDVVKR